MEARIIIDCVNRDSKERSRIFKVGKRVTFELFKNFKFCFMSDMNNLVVYCGFFFCRVDETLPDLMFPNVIFEFQQFIASQLLILWYRKYAKQLKQIRASFQSWLSFVFNPQKFRVPRLEVEFLSTIFTFCLSIY